MISCPFKGMGRDSLPCEATPELRRASQCPDCINQYLREKMRPIASTEASSNSWGARA